MSRPGANLGLVLQTWADTLRTGSTEALATIMAEDVVWQGPLPELVCRGREEALERLRYGMVPAMPGITRVEAEEAGDRVVVNVASTEFGDGPEGAPLEDSGQRTLVFTFRDGKIVRMESFPAKEAALRALASRRHDRASTTVNVGDPALALLEVGHMRGLEIGPLARPRVQKTDGPIFYVDHCSTDELRESYSANSIMRPYLDEIVEVDYVIKGGAALSDAVGGDGPFDYVIASHVLEHLANPIGWLQDLEKILTADGLVSLVIPDKRFCFDINRVETRAQEWVDWYLRDLRTPSYGQLFDFFAHVTTIDGMVDTPAVWEGTVDYTGVRRTDVPDPDASAFAVCLQYRESGAYIDVHAGVYTPGSFLGLLELGIRLDLVHYGVAYFAPTRRGSLEFHVTLRTLADRRKALESVVAARAGLDVADVAAMAPPRQAQRHAAPQAVQRAEPTVAPAIPVMAPPGGLALAPPPFELSAKERRLIALKRRFMEKLRLALS